MTAPKMKTIIGHDVLLGNVTTLSGATVLLFCVVSIEWLAVVLPSRAGLRVYIPEPWHIAGESLLMENALVQRIPGGRWPTALYRRARRLPPAKGQIRPSP